jgi:hypothetical protein
MFLDKYLRLGKISIDLATLFAVFIIIAGAAIRFMLILNGYPTTNSDEATVGLMALHISQGHDFPAFLYGQASLGALEAYMGAALFFILGPSVFALRLGVLIFFIAFLVCMYVLTRLLYSKGLALATLILLGLGTPELFYRSIPAFAGHAETPLFGALIMLLSIWLGLASRTSSSGAGPISSRRLILLYALWGIVAGAAFWNDALAGAFIIAGGLFLLVCCRSTLGVRTIAALLSGLVIGILPMILNDLLIAGGSKSLSVVGFLTASAGPGSHSIFEHLAASFLVSLPVASGGTGVCTIANWRTDPWPITSHTSAQVLQCTALHGTWAAVMIAAWFAAVIMEVSILARRRLLVRANKKAAGESAWAVSTLVPTPSAKEQRAVVLRYARLMLLGSAALTWLVFTLSSSPIVFPWGNYRYLIGLGVATPAVLWPLWKAITARVSTPIRLTPTLLSRVLCAAILLAYAGSLAKGTVDTFNQAPPSAVVAQQQQVLAATLVRLHLRHIYSEYWTCDLVSFLTKEQVICSVLDENLNPGVNRYAPYVPIVASDPAAAYIFPINSPQAQAFARKAAQSSRRYHVMQFDNYILYQPIAPPI